MNPESNRERKQPEDSSLTHHLSSLIANRSDPWLRSLISNDHTTAVNDNPHQEIVGLRTKSPIKPTNHEISTSRLARALWPAFQAHSRLFEGTTASLIINSDSPSFSPAATSNSLDDLWHEITEVLPHAGVIIEKSTLYTIKLGEAAYTILALVCPYDPADWGAFRTWRTQTEERFGVNVRLSRNASPKVTQERVADSPLESEAFINRVQHYYTNRRREELPPHLQSDVIDWRDTPFFSIDDGKTIRPEDLFYARMHLDGAIEIRNAQVLSGNGSRYFEPFQDLYSIGVRTFIGSDGAPLATHIAPVLCHNRNPMDFRSVSNAALSSFYRYPLFETDRARQILENHELATQISVLYEAADRILKRKLASGSVIEIDMNASAVRVGEMQSELVVSTVLGAVQQLIAHWALASKNSPALIASRSQYRDDGTLAAIRKVLPTITKQDLHIPERRSAIAWALREAGHPALIAKFAELLRNGHRTRHLVRIRDQHEIRSDDSFRFKGIRSRVGNINNLQISHALLSTPKFNNRWISDAVSILNQKQFRGEHEVSQREIEFNKEIAARNNLVRKYINISRAE